MAQFTWFPNASHQKDTEPRILSAKFGDGYEMRVPDGINTMPQMWSLSFTGSVEEMGAIDAFLTARAGAEAFEWITPEEKPLRCICRSWSKSRERGVKVTLTCKFEQVFG